MSPIITETGKQFDDVDDLLAFIRECEKKMLDPSMSAIESSTATVEMLYAFQALDRSLRRGGHFPLDWQFAEHPPRDTPG